MIKFKYIGEGEITYATSLSAGFDIIAQNSYTILPGEIESIPTGLYVVDYNVIHRPTEGLYIPELQIRSKSGMVKNFGLVVAGGVGTVDADYKDEIIVLMQNISNTKKHIGKGSKIAQGVISYILQLNSIRVKDEKRTGGFGSTGQ